MQELGTLVVFFYVNWVDLDGRHQAKKITVLTDTCTQQQARGLFKDCQGMNQNHTLGYTWTFHGA